MIITVGDVPTLPEMAEGTVGSVEDLALPKNAESSYMANSKKVKAFIEDGRITPAINQLEAFINKLQKCIANGDISEEEGNVSIDMANVLLEALGG